MHRATGRASLPPLFILAIWVALATAAVTTCQAATGPELLLKGVEHYDFAEFEQAKATLQQALAAPDMTPALKAKAHTYLGLVCLAQGDEKAALEAFRAARREDPSYRPDPRRLPPRALRLFAQAGGGSPAPPPPPPTVTTTPPPPPPAARPKALPRRGYVVDVSGKEITIDLGRKQGVKRGDRFQVFEIKTLIHPVTGERLVKKIKVAILKVVAVEDQISTARAIVRHAPIKPGQRLAKLKRTPAPKPKPSSKAKPRPKPAAKPPVPPAAKTKLGWLRVAVWPAVSLWEGDIDPKKVSAQAIARALNRQRGLKLQAFAVTPPQVARIKKALGFKPEEVLLESGVSLRGLASLLTGEGKAEDVVESRLKPSEVLMIREVTRRLGAKALLLWGFEEQGAEDQVYFSYNLHLQGKDRPLARDTIPYVKDVLPGNYLEVMLKGIREGLARWRRGGKKD